MRGRGDPGHIVIDPIATAVGTVLGRVREVFAQPRPWVRRAFDDSGAEYSSPSRWW